MCALAKCTSVAAAVQDVVYCSMLPSQCSSTVRQAECWKDANCVFNLLYSYSMCIQWCSKWKQTCMSVIFQIIAFDELRTDFKNPIDQSNPTRAVRTLLFHFFQKMIKPSCPPRNPFCSVPRRTLSDLQWRLRTSWGFHSKNGAYDPKFIGQHYTKDGLSWETRKTVEWNLSNVLFSYI